MGAIEKTLLTGGNGNGRMIKVVATVTAGTIIHTAVATHIDEIWLWGVNSDTTDRKLTIEFGGVSVPDDLMEFTVPAEAGLFLLIPGFVLQTAIAVRAFCPTANVIMIGGYVNRNIRTEGL